MSRLYGSVTELIGATPLLRLQHFARSQKLGGNILAKLEFFNPTGSAKDRAALSMICDAENKGLLKPGSVVIEPTSGNTGIGLAAICAVKGYRAIIVMPDSMSRERQLLMTAYGAELILTPGALGMQGAVDKAKELSAEIPDSFIPSQFDNPANARAHYCTTGPEIWAACEGKIDFFVAGVGTGGTITGVGEYLKEQNPNIQIVAVEPAGSPLLSRGIAGKHGLQGIGANFIPELLNTHIYDQVLTATEEEAYTAAALVGRTEGILVGISSGAALHAAALLAKLPENAGKNIVTLLPDTGERYLSTPMFNQ